MNHNVSIVAIGTELTTGEITNSNAAWLSEKFVDLGFEVACHLTVPDDRNLIQAAFNYAHSNSSLIVVTGGLGPTSDDFTRDEVAKFCNQPLEWNDVAWNATTERLRSLNVEISESNRQQCFFPRGSNILINSQGTAAAFSLRLDSKQIFILPGPPHEIAAIWQDHLSPLLVDKIPKDQKLNLFRWVTMGMSESKLGEIVEKCLKDAKLTIGYRARIPYVDLKIWYTEAQKSDFFNTWRPKIESDLRNVIVGEGDFDAAEKFCRAVSATNVHINDSATFGRLASRILRAKNILHCNSNLNITSSVNEPVNTTISSQNFVTVTADVETGAWTLNMNSPKKTDHVTETSRYKGTRHVERLRSYICENALLKMTAFFTP